MLSMYITQIKPLENGDYESVPSAPLQPQIIQAKSQKNTKFPRIYLAKGVMRSFSIVYNTNQTGSFPCILHKSNPWKTGNTKVYKNTPSSTSNNACYKQKKPKFARNQRAKRVIRSFSMYITLHNRTQKNPQFARNH